jgi:uncharacterized protein YdbL (DUF1318 family)
MNTIPSNLGINIGLDYAKYQAIKGDKGDYVDFLLQYDSLKSEAGDDSWMNSLLGTNDLLSSVSPETLAMLDSKDTQNIFGATKEGDGAALMVDAQVSALKMQLLEGFRQRYETSEKNETVKASKIAALYTQAAAIKLPSRLLG